MSRILLLSVLVASCLRALSQSPNIIIINMDDLGYGDINIYEKHSYRTPNMDSIALNGVRFTNCYTAQANCTGSRAALLTGCYPARIGMSGNMLPWSKVALNPEEQTIASILKANGYRTGMVGVWNLGPKPPYLPGSYGFETFYGLPYSNELWPLNTDGTAITQASNWRLKLPMLPLYEDNIAIKTIKNITEQSQLSSIFTDKSINFIRQNKNEKFFLYLAYSMPHVPLAVSKPFSGKSGIGIFADVMEELDFCIGRIVETLKKAGIEKNTILILTSDNGPSLAYGDHAGSAGGLREGKGTVWEGGIKIPMLVQWVGTLGPSTICSSLISNLDMMPTLLSICKIPAPAKKIDGISCKNIFLNPQETSPRQEMVFYDEKNGLRAIRKGKWKLIFPHSSPTFQPAAARANSGFAGIPSSINLGMSLYDLEKDPFEKEDLQFKNPEIVASMKKLADEFRKELGDELNNSKGTGIRPAAKPQ